MHSHPATTEAHFTGSAVVRDVIIGMSDGLTVPFALAAGLAGVVTSSFLVLVAGLAEIVAGSIAMGLGGYLAARSDQEHYHAELAREEREIQAVPEMETQEVREVLAGYGLRDEPLENAVCAITADHQRWLDFMMRNELNLEPPDPQRGAQQRRHHRLLLHRRRNPAPGAVRLPGPRHDGLAVERRTHTGGAAGIRRGEGAVRRRVDG